MSHGDPRDGHTGTTTTTKLVAIGASSTCCGKHPLMADIMIRCPTFGMAVPTGFTTEMIILDTLDFPLTVHCAACREIHRWTRRDAWIEKDRQVN